jgi:hypothetical protein
MEKAKLLQVPTEVLAVILDWIGVRARGFCYLLVCRKWWDATIYRLENELSCQLSLDGLWRPKPRHRPWIKPILSNLAHLSAEVLGTVRAVDLTLISSNPRFAAETITAFVGVFNATSGRTLTFLKFSPTDFNEVAIQTMCMIPGLERLETRYIVAHWMDSCMKTIATVTTLRSLDLTGCETLTDAGLLPLTALQCLESLCLAHCKGPSNATITCLVPKLPNLRDLNITSCRQVTDAGFVDLPDDVQLPLLSLDISLCTGITDLGIIFIKKSCPNLTKLEAYWCLGITDNSAKVIAELPKMSSINVSACGLTDLALVDSFHRLSSLQTLNLSTKNQFSDVGLRSLLSSGNLSATLRYLDLEGISKLTDAICADLSQLLALEHLNISNCPQIGDDGVGCLTTLVNLQALNLSCLQKLTSLSAAHVSRLSKLQHLDMSMCPEVSDADGFRTLTDLRVLDLTRCTISDSTVAAISRLQLLEELCLKDCTRLTDASVLHLSTCRHLRSLSLSNCCRSMSDSTLSKLSRLSTLENLNLSHAPLSDATVQLFLSELPSLTELNVKWCGNLSARFVRHIRESTCAKIIY